MPVLGSIRERFATERPLDGLRIGACLHVTAETANLARTLVAGGAEVALCAANPLSTQDDVVAALGAGEVAVHAARGEDRAAYERHIAAVLDTRPRVTLDDGADLLRAIHDARPELLDEVIGGTEETSAGAIRLRSMADSGALARPVIAVNEARTAELFDGRYGTGQSTLDGIVAATHLLLAGRTVVVFGYGECGRGVALRAAGAGARVIVCEVDAVRALEARMDGYDVLPGIEAAAVGDVFVTVTGAAGVIGKAHLRAMRDGAILANAGHFDVEIDLDALTAMAGERVEVRPSVEQFVLCDGRRVNLLASGRVVNLAAGEGHPPAVMDVAFAFQALAVEHLVRDAGGLEPGVHPVPEPIDAEVARLKLDVLGVRI